MEIAKKKQTKKRRMKDKRSIKFVEFASEFGESLPFMGKIMKLY